MGVQGSQTRRQMYAEQTRAAIIAAARRLFAEQGYAQTKVEEIARDAQVAPITVYSAVGGKVGILRTLMEIWSATPKNEELLNRVLAEREPRAVIACLAAGVRSLREEFGDIAYFMQDAAPHDPDVHKSLEVATGRYRAFFVHVVEHLANLGSLRADLTQRDAADICWFYFGYWGYYTLHNENGWPYERAEAWLCDAATAALLKD
jgi:AcrR family transcriptional regulator